MGWFEDCSVGTGACLEDGLVARVVLDFCVPTDVDATL